MERERREERGERRLLGGKERAYGSLLDGQGRGKEGAPLAWLFPSWTSGLTARAVWGKRQSSVGGRGGYRLLPLGRRRTGE